jgi:NADH-quinone oxidoreductase subunit G
LLKRKKLFKHKSELVDSMMNYLKLNKRENNIIENDINFVSEKITIDPIDYYFSNVIARASKTMFECRKEKIKIEKTGTEG